MPKTAFIKAAALSLAVLQPTALACAPPTSVGGLASGAPNANGFYQMDTQGHCLSNGHHPAGIQPQKLVDSQGALLEYDDAVQVAGRVCGRLSTCIAFDVNSDAGRSNSPYLYALNGQAMIDELKQLGCTGFQSGPDTPWLNFEDSVCDLAPTQSGEWIYYDNRVSGNRCAPEEDCEITMTQTGAHIANVCMVKGEGPNCKKDCTAFTAKRDCRTNNCKWQKKLSTCKAKSPNSQDCGSRRSKRRCKRSNACKWKPKRNTCVQI